MEQNIEKEEEGQKMSADFRIRKTQVNFCFFSDIVENWVGFKFRKF